MTDQQIDKTLLEKTQNGKSPECIKSYAESIQNMKQSFLSQLNPSIFEKSRSNSVPCIFQNGIQDKYKSYMIEKCSKIKDGLTMLNIAAYSVGHLGNDLCAAMWFFYLSWYLKRVVNLDATLAGGCLLSGQLADGITTPLVGLLSDKSNTRWGKRKPWYVFGTILVIPCFLGIFSYPEFINQTDENGNIKSPQIQMIWYLTLPALFNVGWASVQIAHMSVVNQLSNNLLRKDRLVNNRNGFTYVANCSILTLALFMFAFIDNQILQWRYLCFICLGSGLITTLFFIFNINEPYLTKKSNELSQQHIQALEFQSPENTQIFNKENSQDNNQIFDDKQESKSMIDWLKLPTFYMFGVVYMLVRISINITMTMMPFYLQDVSGYVEPKGSSKPTSEALAAVPLCQYVISLLFSFLLQDRLTKKFKNRFIPMFSAVLIIAITSIPLLFLNGHNNYRWLVYPLFGFQGVGFAIMINTSTSMISDVIGNDSENSAFVYGFYSLLDKFANGILLFTMIKMYTYAGDDEKLILKTQNALSYIMGITPVICAILAFGLTYIGFKLYSHKLANIAHG